MNVTSFSHLNRLSQTARLFWRASGGLLLLLAATVSAAAATIVVNSTDENNGSGCPSVKCTLRDAINTERQSH